MTGKKEKFGNQALDVEVNWNVFDECFVQFH